MTRLQSSGASGRWWKAVSRTGVLTTIGRVLVYYAVWLVGRMLD